MDDTERLFADAEKPKEAAPPQDLEADVAQELNALREGLLKLADDGEIHPLPPPSKC